MKTKKMAIGTIFIGILLLIIIIVLFATSSASAVSGKMKQSVDILLLIPKELKAAKPVISEEINVPDIVLDAAVSYVDYAAGIYPDFERDYSNWKIESLAQVYTYEDFNGMTLSVYCLNYRFLAKNPEKIELAGGMEIDEEGWVIPDYSNSNFLIFRQDGETLSYLTAMFENDCQPGDELFDHDLSLRLQEDAD